LPSARTRSENPAKPRKNTYFSKIQYTVRQSGDFSKIDVISGFGSVFCALASAWQTATFPSAAARPLNFASSGQWSSSGLRAAGTHASVFRPRAPALLCMCVYLLSSDIRFMAQILKGMSLCGQPQEARELLQEMRQTGITLDVWSYTTGVAAQCNGRDMTAAENLVQDMLSAVFDFDTFS